MSKCVVRGKKSIFRRLEIYIFIYIFRVGNIFIWEKFSRES